MICYFLHIKISVILKIILVDNLNIRELYIYIYSYIYIVLYIYDTIYIYNLHEEKCLSGPKKANAAVEKAH